MTGHRLTRKLSLTLITLQSIPHSRLLTLYGLLRTEIDEHIVANHLLLNGYGLYKTAERRGYENGGV